MASQDWMYNLPVAGRTLCLAPGLMCQEALQQRLAEIAAEFTWLSEIADETYKFFSVRSLKLQNMPKTPSMKQRVQQRSIQKVETAIHRKVTHEWDPVPSKFVPKIQKFESPRKTPNASTALNRFNETVSNCQKSSKVGGAENKRTTQQSVNQFSNIKSSELMRSAKWPSGQKREKENKLPVRKMYNERKAGEVREVAKVKALVSKKFEEKSQRMEEYATDCEHMFHKNGTGRSVVKLGTTNKMAGSSSKLSCNQSSLGDISHQFNSSKPCSGKVHQKFKPNNEQKQDMAKCETEHKSNIESRSLVSGMDMKSQSSPVTDQHRGISEVAITDVGTRRLNETENKQCQDDTLNETMTVVTEVFEIVDKGEPARLKEFEIVKIKTAKTSPVNQILKPQAVLTDNASYHTSLFRKANEESSTEKVFPEDTRTRLGQIRGTNMCYHTSAVGLEIQKPFTEESCRSVQNKFRTADISETVIVCNSDMKTATSSPNFCITNSSVRNTKKSLVEEMGLLPAPTNSYITDQNPVQKQDEVKSETEKNSNVKSRNLVSRMNMASQSSAFIDQTRDITDANNKRRLNEPENKQCQDDTLNETVTVVTEVYEIVDKGEPARLKEFEIVKTKTAKTAPVIETLKPQAVLTNNASYQTCQFKTRAQTESSTKEISAEDTLTRLGQNKGTNICHQTRNTMMIGLLPAPTISCISDKSSVIPQEQRMLKEKETEDRHKERLRKASELRKQKLEEQKKLREEMEQRIAEAREMRLRDEQERKDKIKKRLETKAILNDKLMQEECKDAQDKQKEMLTKQTEFSALEKDETDEQFKKLNEQVEEIRRQEEFIQKKKDGEETVLKRQKAEERQKQEEQWTEFERKRKEERLRLKQAEEEKERERERQRREKEKQIAFDIAERERIEREKKVMKDRKVQEEYEKLKAMERERLRHEQERKHFQQQQQETQQLNKQNSNLYKKSVNNTQTLCNISIDKTTSYELTPVKQYIISKSSSSDNYDIEDKCSDESTDDEEAPKKKIPEWATGTLLNAALIRQIMNPPDLEEIFRITKIEPPELVLVFRGRWRPRYKLRTSSAIWNSPPLAKH